MGQAKKIVIVVMSMIEMFMFSGVHYGYNSLIPTFKDAAIFSRPCGNLERNQTITCTTEQTYTRRAFVTWIIAQAVTSVVLGVVLDNFGLKIMKIIAAASFLWGFICFGFTPTCSWLIFVAVSLFAISGHCLQLANISLAVLFKGNVNIFVFLLCTLFDASAIFIIVIKRITDLGSPFGLVCSLYSSVGATVILGSIVLLKSRAEDLLSNNANSETYLNIEKNEIDNTPTKKEDNSRKVSTEVFYQEAVNVKFPTLVTCLISPEYIIQVAFLAVLGFRFTFFITQMPPN